MVTKSSSKAKIQTTVFTIFLLVMLVYAQAHSAATVIVAVGDSITWGALSAGGWVTQLRDRLQLEFPDEYEVINKGVDGDVVEGVIIRLTRDVISYQPNVVIVGIGSNDAIGYDPSPFTDPATNAEDYRAVMNSLFDELKRELPMIPVLIMGMTAPIKEYAEISGFGELLVQFDQESLDTQFKKYNDVLKELAPKYGYFYVDIPAEWPQNIEESWELIADGLHPNDAGYEKMADIVYAVLTSTVSVESHYKLTVTWGGLKR